MKQSCSRKRITWPNEYRARYKECRRAAVNMNCNRTRVIVNFVHNRFVLQYTNRYWMQGPRIGSQIPARQNVSRVGPNTSPLWSSGQSSWLQIQRFRCPLSLAITTEELLGRKSSSSGLENREYGRRDSSRWPCFTIHPQKLALTSPTSGGHKVSIVRSRTKVTEFSPVGPNNILKSWRQWGLGVSLQYPTPLREYCQIPLAIKLNWA
jgi:hypothetical protein